MSTITIEKDTLFIITTKDEDLTPIQPEQSSFNIRRVLLHINPNSMTINLYKGKTASQKTLNKARTIAREINAKHGFRYTIKQHIFNSAQKGWELYQQLITPELKPEEPMPEPKQSLPSEPKQSSEILLQPNALDTTNHPVPQSLAIMLASILNESLPTPFPQDPAEVKKILHNLVDKLVEQNTSQN